MEVSTYYVYVLQNPQGRLYIGFTNDLKKRFRQHQDGEAGWTRNRGPWKLVQYETFTEREDAVKRERNLKRGRINKELRKLISSGRAGPSGIGRIDR